MRSKAKIGRRKELLVPRKNWGDLTRSKDTLFPFGLYTDEFSFLTVLAALFMWEF